jgi:hypothetical protein
MSERDDDEALMETTETTTLTWQCDQGHTWPVTMATQYETDPATGETPEEGHPSGTIGPTDPADTKRCPTCGSENVWQK